MTNRERRRWFAAYLVLTLVLGATAGLVSSLSMQEVLEEYAATLFSQRGPSTTPQNGTARQDDDEAVARVAEVAQASVVLVADRTLDARLPSSWISASDARGVGVVASADGWVLVDASAFGALDPLKSIDVWVDGQRFAPTRVVRDTLTSYALVKLDADGLTPVAFAASENVTSGGRAYVVPEHHAIAVTTVTHARWYGDVWVAPAEQYAATWRLAETPAIAAPVFDARGELLGLVGDGVLYPMHQGLAFVREVMRDGATAHAGLGAHVVDVARVLNMDASLRQGAGEGALLVAPGDGSAAVVDGSPADVAGLRAGDIIRAVDDVRVNGTTSLAELLRVYDPGETAALRVLRDGAEQTLSVTFADLADLVY